MTTVCFVVADDEFERDFLQLPWTSPTRRPCCARTVSTSPSGTAA
ncbi:hypothetical protein ACFQ3Z_01805 [Streptomyces nogalater]